MVKYIYPYFLRSTYSSRFMDLIRRDVFRTEVLCMVKHWAKVSEKGITERKSVKIENLYFNAHLISI